MYNLEKSIADWRQQMHAAGIQTPVPLVELEAHLRDDIDQQVRSGMTEPAAFEAAVQKLGQVQTVQAEFEKVEGAKATIQWWFLEVTLVLITTVFPLCMCRTVLHFKPGYLTDLTPSQKTSSLAAIAVFALLAWSGRLGCKLFPVICAKRTRDIVTALAVAPVLLWWLIFLIIIVPRHDFDMAQFTMTFLWGFISPAGAMLGLVWGMEAAARKRSAVSVP